MNRAAPVTTEEINANALEFRNRCEGENVLNYMLLSATKRIAEDLRTPSATLTKLSEDKYWGVRRAVALNPHTPPEILTKLASDENLEVRNGVAKNPNCPDLVRIMIS
jgi:Leucine rich repeat variant